MILGSAPLCPYFTNPLKMIHRRIYSLLLIGLLATTACQEDEPRLPPVELLKGRQWQLASRMVESPDGAVEKLPLDYCDVELWEFENDLLTIDYHFVALTGQPCVEASYSLTQSFVLLDDHVLLKGYQQELTSHWEATGRTLSDMQIVSLNNDAIRVEYQLTVYKASKPHRTTIIDTLVLHATTGPYF